MCLCLAKETLQVAWLQFYDDTVKKTGKLKVCKLTFLWQSIDYNAGSIRVQCTCLLGDNFKGVYYYNKVFENAKSFCKW